MRPDAWLLLIVFLPFMGFLLFMIVEASKLRRRRRECLEIKNAPREVVPKTVVACEECDFGDAFDQTQCWRCGKNNPKEAS